MTKHHTDLFDNRAGAGTKELTRRIRNTIQLYESKTRRKNIIRRKEDNTFKAFKAYRRRKGGTTTTTTTTMSSSSSSSSSPSSFFSMSPTSNTSVKQRKVVKATPPPPIPIPEEGQATSGEKQERSVSFDEEEKKETKQRSYWKSPMSEDEQHREMSEKRRKGNEKAAEAHRKGQRMESTNKRRMESGGTGKEVGVGAAIDAEGGDQNDLSIPAIRSHTNPVFSVASKFPEHKRNVDKASLSDLGENKNHSGKKSRTDDSEADENARAVDDEKETAGTVQSYTAAIPGWLKVAIPVVAVAAIVMMKFVKKQK